MKRLLLPVGLFVLAALASIDAVRLIPPLADDYWIVFKGPGHLYKDYSAVYGWAARPLGIAFMDGLNTLIRHLGLHMVPVLIALRVLSLVLLFVTLERLFRLSKSASFLIVGLFALIPASGEAWTLLCNTHLAIAVPLTALTLGLYAHTIDVIEASGVLQWRRVVLCGLLQIVTCAVYEQPILAIPTFVGGLLLESVWRRRIKVRAGTILGGVSALATLCWLSAMFSSGYVASRSVGGHVGGAEAADLVSAVQALWVAFVKHNQWRLVEMVRLRHLGWWDHSGWGLLAAVSTLVFAAAVGVLVSRTPSESSAKSRTGLIPAALAATYAAVLPVGFAYPGFPSFSRMYYLPGFFVALGLGLVLFSLAAKRPALLGIIAAALLLWNGALSRRYLGDIREGSLKLRQVASALAELPDSTVSGGVLVVAQGAYGTFSSSGVEPWSLRPAARLLTGKRVVGPLFFTASCADAQRGPAYIRDENSKPVSGPAWGHVLLLDTDGTRVLPSLDDACHDQTAARNPG